MTDIKKKQNWAVLTTDMQIDNKKERREGDKKV